MPETRDRRGWIKLHRELIDSKLWSCSDATLRVALYLLLEANHEPRYVRRLLVQPGQTVRSLTRISDDCHVSRKAVRYAIKTLQDDGFLEIDEPFGAQQGHRLTICKYGSYQADNGGEGTARAHEGSNAGTHEGNTNKNGENVKTEKKNTPQPPTGDQLVEETCSRILDYLNEKAGRSYRKVTGELRARIKSNDLTEDEAKLVVDCKVDEWADNPEMNQYLTPTTLFRPSNADKYREQAERWDKKGRPKQGGTKPGNRKLNAMEVDF